MVEFVAGWTLGFASTLVVGFLLVVAYQAGKRSRDLGEHR